MNFQNFPLVSVVITTKNEEDFIENCLKSIKNQSYPQKAIEIIVVDNNSEDKTKEIARKFTEKIFNKGSERASQRNYGILERSKGEYILFLDADMILSKKLLEKAVKKMEKTNIVGLYIPEKIIGKGFFCKVRTFERTFYNGTSIDCVRFIKKKTFLKINGFDENLIGPEDWDLDKRLRKIGKTSILNKKDGFIEHDENNVSLKEYLLKKNYYAKSLQRYINKWGRNDQDIKKQFGFWYRYLGVFLENEKWKGFISHPLLVFGLYFLKFLTGLIYIMRTRNE